MYILYVGESDRVYREKFRLCLAAFLMGFYQNKAEKNRRLGLRLIKKGEPLTSLRLIRMNHKTSDYGYKALFYEAKYLARFKVLSCKKVGGVL